MAISPPNFQKDAVPTPQGWRHPRTNELLVSRKISADDINEYYGIKPEVTMLQQSLNIFKSFQIFMKIINIRKLWVAIMLCCIKQQVLFS